MFKLSISNCLANKTSLDLYSKCIFKGIKPISTEKLNDWDSFIYIPSFFDRQIKQNYHLFKKFRQTTSGTKETFFIPKLNLEMEYIELDHCAGHKMEYTWGSYQRLTITKPFYFREDISEWSGDNEVFSSCLINKKEPKENLFIICIFKKSVFKMCKGVKFLLFYPLLSSNIHFKSLNIIFN